MAETWQKRSLLKKKNKNSRIFAQTSDFGSHPRFFPLPCCLLRHDLLYLSMSVTPGTCGGGGRGVSMVPRTGLATRANTRNTIGNHFSPNGLVVQFGFTPIASERGRNKLRFMNSCNSYITKPLQIHENMHRFVNKRSK